MPKGFIYFLIVAQGILTAVHLVIYELAVLFFPILQSHRSALLVALMVLSFSFLGFLILTHFYDHFLLNWGNILASVWMVLGMYFLFASAIALMAYLIFNNSLNRLGDLTLIVSLLLTVYGLINARIVRLTEITVRLPNLPAFWQGKTAIMVSDLHLGQVLGTGFAKKIVGMINKENPEIVFIPGDFFDGTKEDFTRLANEFKTISAPLGTYFCSGNHELFAGYQKCENSLKAAGVKILENQKVEVEGLQIAGVAYKAETMADLPLTLKNLQIDYNKPSILLKHVPSQVKEVSEADISLMLCGHSHHGQIWPGRHITKAVFKGFDYGLKALGNLQVFTSSGAGTWGPPMRVFTKAEIVKIKFESS